MPLMICSDSSSACSRPPTVLKSMPSVVCSSSNQPAPMPRLKRPPLMWSSVQAAFAVMRGMAVGVAEHEVADAGARRRLRERGERREPSRHGPSGSTKIG
jgi:hypothetical protein